MNFTEQTNVRNELKLMSKEVVGLCANKSCVLFI